jgi:hypothetical protein
MMEAWRQIDPEPSITRSHRLPRDRERREFDMSDTLDWNAKTIAREYVTPTMYLPHDTEPDSIYVALGPWTP